MKFLQLGGGDQSLLLWPAALLGRSPNSSASSIPTFRTLCGVATFAVASAIQHKAHVHLARLPKHPNYILPTHPLFRDVLCPHYTAECLIYLSLAALAAPQAYSGRLHDLPTSSSHRWLNQTIASSLLFVVVNLGVTARGTRNWYQERFGKEAIQEKRRMVPGIF